MKINRLPLEDQLSLALLEDFWQRQSNRLRHRREVTLFGHPLTLSGNSPDLFSGVDLALRLYSQSAQTKNHLGHIELVAQAFRQPSGPPPDGLMPQITYSGSGDWLMMHLGSWAMAHCDLRQKRATAVIDPQLVARPDLVAQCLWHTLFLNLLIADGYGLLHASCLVQDSAALLLLAPHNTGKSTTALRLALAGYRLLTDSMVFVDEAGYLHGFPVGIVKLRADMLDQFSSLRPHLKSEIVRQETKYRVDLRAAANHFVQETAVRPQRLVLCLLTRHDRAESIVTEVTETAVAQAVLQNSLYVDRAETWQQNLASLRQLLVGQTAVQLSLGTDPASLETVITQLFS